MPHHWKRAKAVSSSRSAKELLKLIGFTIEVMDDSITLVPHCGIQQIVGFIDHGVGVAVGREKVVMSELPNEERIRIKA